MIAFGIACPSSTNGAAFDAGDAAYWLMMQIAMAVGLATTYPAQVWLVRRGVKHAMGRPLCE